MIKVSVMYPNKRRRAFRPRLLPRQAHAAGQGAHGRRAASSTRSTRAWPVVRRAHRPPMSACATSSATRSKSFQAGFGPHAKEIMADIPNYTDIAPVMQISEVVVGP